MWRVNIIAWDNGVGLSRDMDLLGAALAAGGDFEVTITRRGRGTLRKIGRPFAILAQTWWQRLRHGAQPRFDLNIVLEHVWTEYLPWARHTAFIPNPEWCTARDVSALPRVALVLVKTAEAARLFDRFGVPIAYIGFTSPDRRIDAVARERAFFHLAGRSRNKGSEALLDLWLAHPHWPPLTVVQSPRVARPRMAAANIRHLVDYVSDGELARLQNAHRFHLCPSETEGFGHYIVEAMSVAATTVTLDAPPMNELVRPDRGVLVPAAVSGRQNLATTHFADAAEMARAIDALVAESESGLGQREAAARAWFEANHAAFAPRLQNVLRSFLSASHAGRQ